MSGDDSSRVLHRPSAHGGAQKHLVELLRVLDRRRFSPRVWTVKSGGELAGESEYLGVPMHGLAVRRSLLEVRSLLRIGQAAWRLRREGVHFTFLLLLLIAVLGATLRIYALAERSLWLDEAISAQFASQSISKIVTNTTDPHPPLYYMLLHTWVSFFGISEQSLRSLSVVFGTVAIVLIGLLGFLLYDRRTGLFAALFMATMVFPLHYAREARGYSVFLVMTLVLQRNFIPVD